MPAAQRSPRLIGEGADLECVNAEAGLTALMAASSFEEFDAVVVRLVAAGAKLDAVEEKYGVSALMLACGAKRAATAMLLIEAGATINLEKSAGSTIALDRASARGFASLMTALARAPGSRLRAHERRRMTHARARALGPTTLNLASVPDPG